MPYEIPPWLVPTQTPGQALVSGVNAGSGIARNMLEARALQQRQQEQDVMLPLKQALYNNQIKSAALDVQKGLYDQQDRIANQAALSELSRTAAEITKNAAWDKPEAGIAIFGIGSRTPSVTATPQYKFYTDQISASKLAKQQLEEKKFEAGVVKAQEKNASDQTIAAMRGDYGLQIQSMKNENAMYKAIADGGDQFDSAAKRREYSEGVRSIFKKEGLSTESKLQAAEELRKNLREGKPLSKTAGMSEEDRSAYDALTTEMGSVRGEMNDLKVDLAKNPKKALLDFKEDNRSIKLREFQQQLDALNAKAQEYLKGPLSKPSSSTATPAPSVDDEDMILVKSPPTKEFPEGRKGRIPKANLEKALKAHYSIYEG